DRITQHVHVSAPDIEILLGGLSQPETDYRVEQNRDERNDNHRCALHRLRVTKARDCLPENQKRNQYERECVNQSNKYPHTMMTVGSLGRRWPLPNPQTIPRQDECERVREVV